MTKRAVKTCYLLLVEVVKIASSSRRSTLVSDFEVQILVVIEVKRAQFSQSRNFYLIQCLYLGVACLLRAKENVTNQLELYQLSLISRSA